MRARAFRSGASSRSNCLWGLKQIQMVSYLSMEWIIATQYLDNIINPFLNLGPAGAGPPDPPALAAYGEGYILARARLAEPAGSATIDQFFTKFLNTVWQILWPL